MPRTASSQIQSRANVKARPSANVRAGNLVANTPVLFRLPAIPTASSQDLAATFSEAAASLPTATLAAVALASAQTPEMATEQAVEVSVTSNAEPQRTWWEHWSSGIVLIVLLIALATASILAWQGSNKGHSKLMADTKNDNVSQSDLSNIEIPKLELPRLEMPKPEMPASTKSTSSADKLETSSVQNSPPARKTGDDMDSSLIPNELTSLTFDEPANNEVKREPAVEPVPHATASLQSPVGRQQEPLFNDNDVVPAKPNISAQPASTPSIRTSANGEKPSIWDSSKTSARDSNKPLTLELGGTDSSPAANPAKHVTEPSNVIPSTTSATLISQLSTDTPKPSADSTGTLLVPKNMQYAGKTSTPEMDLAEYIASYREYSQTQLPTPSSKIDNRYETGLASGSRNQAGNATGTNAAAVGYAQQPTGQPNLQPAVGSNNYTLQPAQNYLPNSAAQQNSALQYQNPQYQFQQPSVQQNQSLPQYSPQNQAGLQYPNSVQTQGSATQGSAAQGLQYSGAQVPYNTQQPASQPSAMQLPPGPIGGYGYGVSPNNGTATLGTTNSPNYPSVR